MSRKTVRAKLPRKQPEKFLELLKDIIEKHTELGAASPLVNVPNVDMAQFDTKRQQAEALYNEAVEHSNLAQSKMHQAKAMMGFAVGQKSTTEGTLYYETVIITSHLKTVFMGVEESMSEYGYNIVIGSAGVGRKRKK